MCILFSYISKVVKPNEFKLIILNNRDEYFFRHSKPASWVNENNIYGNRDRLQVNLEFLKAQLNYNFN